MAGPEGPSIQRRGAGHEWGNSAAQQYEQGYQRCFGDSRRGTLVGILPICPA